MAQLSNKIHGEGIITSKIVGTKWSTEGVDMRRFVSFDPASRSYTVIFETYEPQEEA